MYSGLPEPPTLNAILVCKDYFRSVTFLRNNLIFPSEWYPAVPKLDEIGASCDIKVAETKGTLWKLARFIRYCWAMHRHLRSKRYALVLLHDYLALLAFWLVRRSARYKGITWFNSYDAIDRQNVPVRKFSLMGLVVAKLASLFAIVDFFSLPSVERKPYYPIDKIKYENFVIPNYPALAFYHHFCQTRQIGVEITLIYQGALGRSHGFESLIPFLQFTIRNKPLRLILKGWIPADYHAELEQLAYKCGVSEKLSFPGFGSYRSVPELASTCTIGLAFFTGHDIMNQTLGTASNKIYEYAAVGLPVILFDSPYFRRHLGQRRWAYFSDLSEASLSRTLEDIVDNYEQASLSAVSDFEHELNFERAFLPALHRVIDVMEEG
jgi:glycosyltransferase involved in cell wall biosynthesis